MLKLLYAAKNLKNWKAATSVGQPRLQMQITRLTLCDFGVFRGQVEIDLSPAYGNRLRPIVLFGGLNGSGKTTILNGIRLALYGRLAIGAGISQKAYEAHLIDLIHQGKQALVRADTANVSIEFQHAQLGVRSKYKVIRSWIRKGSNAVETLQVIKDRKPLTELDSEQMQALLNQLVPVGIADLFFFDGEKLAELATEERPAVLADSVKRLVGLHLVERLQSDLSTYIRQQKAGDKTGKIAEELAHLERQRSQHLQEAQALEITIAERTVEVRRLEKEIDAEEIEFGRLGGAWARDRKSMKSEKDSLQQEVAKTEHELRESLATEAAIGVMEERISTIASQIRSEIDRLAAQRLHGDTERRIAKLRRLLIRSIAKLDVKKLDAAIKEAFGSSADTMTSSRTATFQVGERESAELLKVLEKTAAACLSDVQNKATEVLKLRKKLDAADAQLARAPDESVLAGYFQRIKGLEKRLIDAKATRLQLVKEIRSKYWSCIDLTRSIRRVEEQILDGSAIDQATSRAVATHALLGDFGLRLRSEKLRELALALRGSFQRLARKTDLIAEVEFDPTNFGITIKDRQGTIIPRKKLSAGEQQIFAISVLDALLTCSGRSLPLVIDTPLGRLDSQHRERLVREYFPRAAHQVVVLSTDTEVDERFYESLAPHIAHAYYLKFDDETASTTVEEGYFWRSPMESMRHAA